MREGVKPGGRPVVVEAAVAVITAGVSVLNPREQNGCHPGKIRVIARGRVGARRRWLDEPEQVHRTDEGAGSCSASQHFQISCLRHLRVCHSCCGWGRARRERFIRRHLQIAVESKPSGRK